jgi:hypothetical protein
MCENIKIDSREKALDYAIRDYECNEKSVGYGYEIAGNKYWNYLSNKSWEEFLKSMSSLHRAQYNDADGGELKVKQGRWGIYPPKMASFGSSSRFLYNISKNIECFQFEKLLPTRVGGSANLDGYITRGDGDVFVEAKCREIYSSHKTIEVSNVYEEIYKELQKLYPEFSFKNNGRPIKNGKEDNEHFNCTFKFNGKEIIHFDIKQLICHFLAISANILENENANKNIKFIYLIFNPNEVIEQVEKESYKKQITDIYGDTKKEITDYFDMERLFKSIFKIQAKRLGLEGEKDSLFKFHLVDQDNYYKEIIK